jgi:hypothetical protein
MKSKSASVKFIIRDGGMQIEKEPRNTSGSKYVLISESASA